MRRFVLFLLVSLAAANSVHASAKFLFAQPNASAPPSIAPRLPFPKPGHDELIKRQHDETAIIKFAEGVGIRLRAGKFVVLDALVDTARAARQGVSRSKLDVQIAQAVELLERKGAALRRLLPSTSEEALREQHRTGEIRSSKELPDLNLFFLIDFPGRRPSEIADILNELNQLEISEYASPPAKGAPPPVDITPTLQASQQIRPTSRRLRPASM